MYEEHCELLYLIVNQKHDFCVLRSAYVMSSTTDSVIVLLNTKCGGRKCKELLTQICELIHPSRIVELGQEDTMQKYGVSKQILLQLFFYITQSDEI